MQKNNKINKNIKNTLINKELKLKKNINIENDTDSENNKKIISDKIPITETILDINLLIINKDKPTNNLEVNEKIGENNNEKINENIENNLLVKKNISIEDINNNNIYLKELLTKQLKNVSITKKLNYNDIKRISKFLSSSIFDEKKCSLWNGYITNEKNQSKGTYINFYFNKKKIALHRLLYINYINDIDNNDYIKFCCNNKGKCCNIHHMKKYCYNKLNSNDINDKNDENNDNNIFINTDKNKLIIEF